MHALLPGYNHSARWRSFERTKDGEAIIHTFKKYARSSEYTQNFVYTRKDFFSYNWPPISHIVLNIHTCATSTTRDTGGRRGRDTCFVSSLRLFSELTHLVIILMFATEQRLNEFVGDKKKRTNDQPSFTLTFIPPTQTTMNSECVRAVYEQSFP